MGSQMSLGDVSLVTWLAAGTVEIDEVCLRSRFKCVTLTGRIKAEVMILSVPLCYSLSQCLLLMIRKRFSHGYNINYSP